MVRSKGPKQASTRTPLCSSCFPQLWREAPPLLALPAAQETEDLSKAGPSIPHHYLPHPSTLEASSATQEATGRSPPSSLFRPSDSLEEKGPSQDQCSVVGRNDQEEAKTGCSGERSAITPAERSQRPSTAPPISPMSPLPQTYTNSEPSTHQKSEGLRKLSEAHTEANNQHADGAADGAEGSRGGGGDGGSSTPSQGHRGHGEVQPPPAKRTSSTTARAAATTNMSVAVDPALPSSHRSAFAEASRRPTIELDATLSRSSRLPPAPASVNTSSSTALSGRAPSSFIAAIHSRGGSRSAGSVEAHQTPGRRRSLLRDRRTDDAPAGVNEIPDKRLLPGDFGTGAVSPTSVNEATVGTSSSLRASMRSGISTTTSRSGVRGKGRRESSRKTHHRHHRTRRGTKNNNQKQQQQQRQQQRQAVASPSADPSKINSAHSRGRSSSRQQANAEPPEGGGARATNGAVTGAGWGGNDQVGELVDMPSMYYVKTRHTCRADHDVDHLL